ncbi:unnamed protein product [Ceutorhynchus assimilis]|uniref:Intraflagellar transport protein 20 homolog n=1 Tax=Ceutorhynchus assimilis TaxID=467358 RepID=A0A9N9MBG0_9CUCU|nr:unnamed protein product [Ceutorhynchus assimilis]
MSELSQYGVFFDEIDKMCILEPTNYKQTTNLKEESFIYVEKIDEFQKIADKFISTVQNLGEKIEVQKIKAIGARNLLQLMEKQKENNQQQMRAIVKEVSMEVERLRVQLHSLQKTEAQQTDFLSQMKHN